ncbi:hypothetical protein [Pararobbsia alpina]|uniref:Uncharacterized protein n=1 Tax=Pararobbsia alpina TaxID=621374 RepID=A0A6S7CL08_9BURK|nr:hypothetical protein [Pararobbsia alpina]CAB3792357.1 hypothetical protein LMG28138_03329 [Pararobbsia alpina]
MKVAQQKPANALPKDPAGKHAAPRGRRDHEDVAPLPHETDQDAESQHEQGTRRVGRQAHQDLARGLTDTDRRGGDAYQQQTQNDANVNTATPAQKGTQRKGTPEQKATRKP